LVSVPTITPNLWFDSNALEAAEFYVSVFPNSTIRAITHYGEAGPGPAGSVLTVEFDLDGQPYTAINGGPMFTFNEAISLAVMCADQAEVDHYWERLTDGGVESQCGWLKDRFGVSWQVVPTEWIELATCGDQARIDRAMAALLTMGKLDIAAIRAAADAVA
jgi:predicted 3-demethylubiquinone-9 3-methyltransferase (glyoxalase superfamily)